MEKNALYTTTAVLLSISVCHRESGLESKFSETPRCVFGCVTGVLHTRPAEPRTHVVHHVRTTVERDARTRRKQRHVVVTKATLIYERCSVSRVDGLAITRNEGQFVSRLARTSSFRSLFFLFLLLLLFFFFFFFFFFSSSFVIDTKEIFDNLSISLPPRLRFSLSCTTVVIIIIIIIIVYATRHERMQLEESS